MTLSVTWHDRGREPQNKPDPRYPAGIDVDMTAGAAKWCETQLPYPARRCGLYVVECSACGLRVALTTAGRQDDPKSVRVACKAEPG